QKLPLALFTPVTPRPVMTLPSKELLALEELLTAGRTVIPVPEMPKALPAVPLTMVPESVPVLVGEVPVPLVLLLPKPKPFAVREILWVRDDCTATPVKGLVKPLASGSADDDGEKKLVAVVCDTALGNVTACPEGMKSEGRELTPLKVDRTN